jgi:hypothetical protein
MLILDNAPHSEEIWGWFHMQSKYVDMTSSGTGSIDVFSFLLGATSRTEVEAVEVNEYADDCPQETCGEVRVATEVEDNRSELTYRDLTASRFWDLVQEVVRMASGISRFRVGRDVSPRALGVELEKVKSCMLWWAFAEGVSLDKIGTTMDHLMVDRDRLRLNQHYRYRVFYMTRIIDSSYKTLLKTLGGDRVTAFEPPCSSGCGAESVCEEMKGIINKSCAGDRDEFILYAIADVQNRTMGDDHEKLAQLVRFEKFEDRDFESKLHCAEIWRMLYIEHFEEVDEIFDDFYAAHGADSVLYFLSDLLASDLGIRHLDWYGLYGLGGDSGLSNNIFNVLPLNKMKKELLRVYEGYKLS